MISVQEAENAILGRSISKNIISTQLEDSLGKILAEDVFSDMDQPPFHRVAMDGVAINSSLLASTKEFKIIGMIPAGAPARELPPGACCFEIMTGAVLPPGSDMVIRYEDLLISNGVAYLESPINSLGQNIHTQGSDYKKGDLLISAGVKINSIMTSILASAGYSEVKVYQHPKVAILSTGEELVDIHEMPAPHQIRWSNGITLKQELLSFGFNEVSSFKVGDDEEGIRELMKKSLSQFDVLLLTGGVSAGKFDFVPKLLKECGVGEVFHKVSQRPGKPLWFGETKDNKFVFGLPGNPVSCLVNLRKYVIPFLQTSLGQNPAGLTKVYLSGEIKFNKKMTFYCPVKIKNTEGKMMALPISGNGSGDFFQLRDSDGFVELHPSDAPFLEGKLTQAYLWGSTYG